VSHRDVVKEPKKADMMGVDPSDVRHSSIDEADRLVAARYESLLLLRLIHLAHTFLSATPRLANATGFAGAWALFERLSPEDLGRAVRHPLLAAWVASAEQVVRSEVFRRYPEAYPSRLLKEFGRHVLNWISATLDGAEGRISPLGRDRFPLLYGHALLVANEGLQEEDLVFLISDGVLKLKRNHGETIAVVSLDGSDEIEVVSPDWSALALPRVGPLTIDVHTPEYVGATSGTESLDALLGNLADHHSWDQPLIQLTYSYISCISVATTPLPWTAGLARCRSAGRGRYQVAELALIDRIERLLALTPLDEIFGPATSSGDFRTLVVNLGAKWALAWTIGEEAAMDEHDSARWEEVAGRLSRTADGVEFLRNLGAHQASGPVGLKEGSPSDVLHLTAPGSRHRLKFLGFPPLSLCKTRRGTAFRIDDHTAIDELAGCDNRELNAALEVCLASEIDEETSFAIAILAYITGRFTASRDALVRCLEHDPDVEEYRHLLAFCSRHLGDRQMFEKIMFH
jgi:hypothetical protein